MYLCMCTGLCTDGGVAVCITGTIYVPDTQEANCCKVRYSSSSSTASLLLYYMIHTRTMLLLGSVFTAVYEQLA